MQIARYAKIGRKGTKQHRLPPRSELWSADWKLQMLRMLYGSCYCFNDFKWMHWSFLCENCFRYSADSSREGLAGSIMGQFCQCIMARNRWLTELRCVLWRNKQAWEPAVMAVPSPSPWGGVSGNHGNVTPVIVPMLSAIPRAGHAQEWFHHSASLFLKTILSQTSLKAMLAFCCCIILDLLHANLSLPKNK